MAHSDSSTPHCDTLDLPTPPPRIRVKAALTVHCSTSAAAACTSSSTASDSSSCCCRAGLEQPLLHINSTGQPEISHSGSSTSTSQDSSTPDCWIAAVLPHGHQGVTNNSSGTHCCQVAPDACPDSIKAGSAPDQPVSSNAQQAVPLVLTPMQVWCQVKLHRSSAMCTSISHSCAASSCCIEIILGPACAMC